MLMWINCNNAVLICKIFYYHDLPSNLQFGIYDLLMIWKKFSLNLISFKCEKILKCIGT